MRDAVEHRFGCVCVYKLDRFGRSVLNLSQSLALLESYGVRFIAVSQGIDMDQSNPTSRLLLNILASVPAFELELIRERTVAGVRAHEPRASASVVPSESSAGMKLSGSGPKATRGVLSGSYSVYRL